MEEPDEAIHQRGELGGDLDEDGGNGEGGLGKKMGKEKGREGKDMLQTALSKVMQDLCCPSQAVRPTTLPVPSSQANDG